MSLVDRYRLLVLRFMIVLGWVFSSSDLADILICGWYFVIFDIFDVWCYALGFFSNTSVPLAKALEVFDRFGAGVWYIEMYRAAYKMMQSHEDGMSVWTCVSMNFRVKLERWLASAGRYWEMLEGIMVSFQYQVQLIDIFVNIIPPRIKVF